MLIIPCTSHYFLILWFEMDVQTKVSNGELFIVHALTVSSQFKALKGEYGPFNSTWISDCARSVLYIPSSSPVKIQSHLLEFKMNVLMILSIERSVCSFWFELIVWLFSLFFVFDNYEGLDFGAGFNLLTQWCFTNSCWLNMFLLSWKLY